MWFLSACLSYTFNLLRINFARLLAATPSRFSPHYSIMAYRFFSEEGQSIKHHWPGPWRDFNEPTYPYLPRLFVGMGGHQHFEHNLSDPKLHFRDTQTTTLPLPIVTSWRVYFRYAYPPDPAQIMKIMGSSH